MNYKAYKVSRDLAWKILIDEGVNSLPVKVSQICRNLGVSVMAYSQSWDVMREIGVNWHDNDGTSTIVIDTPVIFYNDACSIGRQRFIVAHELGHVLLGHVGQYELVNREPNPGDNPLEQAANTIAVRLLAPACVLWGCGVKSAAQISQLCNISTQAAEYRMQRLEMLYERGKFLTSPLERKVFENFQEYIASHKL